MPVPVATFAPQPAAQQPAPQVVYQQPVGEGAPSPGRAQAAGAHTTRRATPLIKRPPPSPFCSSRSK